MRVSRHHHHYMLLGTAKNLYLPIKHHNDHDLQTACQIRSGMQRVSCSPILNLTEQKQASRKDLWDTRQAVWHISPRMAWKGRINGMCKTLRAESRVLKQQQQQNLA